MAFICHKRYVVVGKKLAFADPLIECESSEVVIV